MRFKHRFFLSLLLFFCSMWIQPLCAQSDSQAQGQVPAGNALPEPYTKEEFPLFMQDIGRFEIITIGSLPIAWFFSSLGFEISRYVGSGFDVYYTPWPFKSEYSYNPSQTESLNALWTAVACSITIATIDFIIIQIARSEKNIKATR